MIKVYYQQNQKQIKYFIKVIIILLISLITVYEIVITIIKVIKEKNIDRNRCIREYMENECDKIKIDDGPIINDFCDEKMKCLQDNIISIIDVIKKFIKGCFSIKKNWILNICFILFIFFIIFLYYKNKYLYFQSKDNLNQIKQKGKSDYFRFKIY